jgi:HEPN domain-containing protein
MSDIKFLGCLTEAQLSSMLEEIDEVLRAKGLKIPQRPLHAFSEVGRRTGKEMHLAHAGTRIGSIVVDGTSDFIDYWYKQRYGDRLNMEWSPGDGVIIIRDDAYRFAVPRILGSVNVVCRPHEMGMNRPNVGVGRQLPTCNILDQITGLTKAYALLLRGEELQAIWDQCKLVMQSYNDIEHTIRAIKNAGAETLVQEALGDLRDSAKHVLDGQRYGQARWHALQSVEKMLKFYLSIKRINYKYTHELQKLISQLGSGLPAIFYDNAQVEQVQCSAGVRYGEESSTLQQAADAWNTALRMCGAIAKQVRQELDGISP